MSILGFGSLLLENIFHCSVVIANIVDTSIDKFIDHKHRQILTQLRRHVKNGREPKEGEKHGCVREGQNNKITKGLLWDLKLP